MNTAAGRLGADGGVVLGGARDGDGNLRSKVTILLQASGGPHPLHSLVGIDVEVVQVGLHVGLGLAMGTDGVDVDAPVAQDGCPAVQGPEHLSVAGKLAVDSGAVAEVVGLVAIVTHVAKRQGGMNCVRRVSWLISTMSHTTNLPMLPGAVLRSRAGVSGCTHPLYKVAPPPARMSVTI